VTDIALNLDAATERLSAAAASLSQMLEREIGKSFRVLEDAAETTAGTIADHLTRAAESGALDFSAMVDDILRSLARLAVDQLVRKPLESVLDRTISAALNVALPQTGSAQGSIGGAPSPFGTAASAQPAPANVTLNVATPDAASFSRSSAQIGGLIARLLSQSERVL